MSEPVKCEKRKRNRFELGLICEELIRNSEDGMVYINNGEYIRHIETKQKSLADFFGVSGAEISQALKLVRRAEPEVIEAVKNGIITPTNATKIVKKSNTREGQLQLLKQEKKDLGDGDRKKKAKRPKSMEAVAKDAERALEIINREKDRYQSSAILRCICDLLKTVIKEKTDDAEIESEVTEVLERIEELYEDSRSCTEA